MLTVIAYASLLVAIISTTLAISGAYKFYWLAAVGIYVFSFLAGFTFGQFTVGLTFVFLVLALGHSLHWIKGKTEHLMFTGAGVIAGVLIVVFVDDYWTFWPIWKLLPESVLS